MALMRQRAAAANYWPGFVDALTTLLLVIIFLLVVFVLAQVVLSQAISGKDAALERLNQQVRELAELLDLERRANEELRGGAAQLSAALAESNRARDELALLLEQMTARASLLEERASRAERALEEAEAKVLASREGVEVRLRQLESLRRDIAALRELRAELENQIAALSTALEQVRQRAGTLERDLAQDRQLVIDLRGRNAALDEELAAARDEIEGLRVRAAEAEAARDATAQELEAARRQVVVLTTRRDELDADLERERAALERERATLGALRDRTKELEARLSDEAERTLLAQKEIEAKEVRLAELLASAAAAEEIIENERALSEERRSQIALLNRQILALREELKRLSALLDAAEAKDLENQTIIKDLGARLNRALAAKVEELSRYRSEFFGRLKEVLGQRGDITVVGDRFVFQSEVLFETASDELGQDGRRQLGQLARTLNEIAAKIPPEINWVLRIDGHTDTRPIRTARFPSNWELSTARAISVVRFLVEQGVPAKRLAATGFAEFQPLDARDDEIAYRRNRRIELKLTER